MFVTNVIEITKDALQTLQRQEVIGVDAQAQDSKLGGSSDQTLEMNLRFIKPSHNFYNHVMSQWFKFLNLIEEQLAE